MVNKTNDIWVFIELKEDGAICEVGLELLNPGRKIAEELNGKLVAIIFGENNTENIEIIKKYGADKIISVEGQEYVEYDTDLYTRTFTQLIEKYAPKGILIGASDHGRDMGPRIACRLDAGLTADCVSIEVDKETGDLVWTRPTLGGNLMAEIVCAKNDPQMGTIRAGVYHKEACRKKEIEVVEEKVNLKHYIKKTRVYEVIQEEGGEESLENAEIIVAGGKGLRDKEGFEFIRELAKELGAAVGATRGAVEQGWASHANQIGQTGRCVNPRIYIACGISGAIQHVVGMSSAEIIIAINEDADAPIFKVADYGVLGDVFVIIPELIKKIKKEKAKGVSD